MRASTSRRSRARRWTVSPCARPICRGRLRIVGESAAGRPFGGQLEPGGAVAISTGAVVPDGADAVVPIENVSKYDNTVEISKAVEPGAHVRPRGGDVASWRGRRARRCQARRPHASPPLPLPASRSCRARAVRASRSSPRAASSSIPAGRYVRARSTRRTASCSRPQLAAAGAEVVLQPPVADDEEALREALERGLAADVARHVGRRFGRRARPRPRGRAGARRRGGLLAGGDQAGQADLLRRARRDARLRPAGESRVRARRLRALRQACAAGACRASRTPAPLRAGPPCGRPAAQRGTRRVRARPRRRSTEMSSCSSRSRVRSRT